MKTLVALLTFIFAFAIIPPSAALAAPLSCDSELNTFSAPNKLMRVSASYAYKLPNGSTADTEAINAGIEAYFAERLDTVQALRLEASSGAAVVDPADKGSIWRVTGNPICVEEPAFNDSVSIFVPVVSYYDAGLTGFLIESRNWKNIELTDLIDNAPTDTIKRLSLYFLEPQIVNPQVLTDFDLTSTTQAQPACALGGPAYLRPGDAAKRVSRMEVGEKAPEWNFEYDYIYFFGQSMPLFGTSFIPDTYQGVSTAAWFDFLYKDFKGDSPHGIPPGVLVGSDTITVMGAPRCGRMYYSIESKSVEGDLLSVLYQQAVITWLPVRVMRNGVSYDGWLPESIHWRYFNLSINTGTIHLYHDFTAYFLDEVPSNAGKQAYFEGWDLTGGLEIAEPGTRKPAALYDMPYADALPNTCATSLPTRLDGAPRARVIVEALNLRENATTSSQPVVGLGQNTVVSLLGLTRCADGMRWQAATVTGGALGSTVVTGWAAENDNAVYYLEPVAERGDSIFMPRPTAVPPVATSTPMPLAQPTQPPAPTKAPTLVPTATPTDPIPG